MWPEVVHLSEIQSRLILDAVPVERAMSVTSQLGLLPLGSRYRIERTQGDLYLYSRGNGYFNVADQ